MFNMMAFHSSLYIECMYAISLNLDVVYTLKYPFSRTSNLRRILRLQKVWIIIVILLGIFAINNVARVIRATDFRRYNGFDFDRGAFDSTDEYVKN